MNQNKKRAWLLLLISVCVTAIFGAACSSKSGGGDGATGSPTATALSNCEVLWASPGTNAGHYDIYVVDAPLANWTTGDHSFDLTVGMETAAAFYDEYDDSVVPPTYLSRAISTNGTYSVVDSGGTDMGQQVTLTDSSGQIFYAINGSGVVGAMVGSGGTGNFQGVWSDPSMPDNPTPGMSGSQIVIKYMGNSVTVGTTITYALCYDASTSFAPKKPIDRIDAAIAHHHFGN